MDQDDIVSISSDHSDGEASTERRAILEPVISRVVDALGGFEEGTYRLGDEVNGCLKDLKRLWRKDDTDDERTVARIFWETRVLPNDLIPILLETAGKGLVEDKRAITCADLITAMTWPIDMAEELKELDDELDKGTDYTQLMQSHLHYKAALLKPGVMQALFGIVLPPLAKRPKERKERDGQVINVVLHLIRNLAFIKDLPSNMHLSADQVELSSLQSKMVRTLSETHTLQLLLTIAANTSNDPLLTSWNTLVLEIFYLLFRGVSPASLTMDQAKQPAENLHHLLALEARSRRDFARNATSRHSRFGTTIAVKWNPNRPRPTDDAGGEAANLDSAATPAHSFVLHRQKAINQEAGGIMDLTKRQKTKKTNKVDELAREDNLSVEAKVILQNLAREFVESCFNPFLSSLLKDIKSERPKITEKDHLRLLYVTKWFLDFFLSSRGQENAKGTGGRWPFGLIAEVTERGWIIWVLKRMREAVDEKPKLWTELQAGIECLTQLLLLIDSLSSTEMADPTLNEAADVLQQQLIYNGEVLDIAFESLRSYREGIQSLTYLDSSVYLAYALLRMLERWGKTKGEDMYVRKKKTKRRKKAIVGEEKGIADVEEEEADDHEEVIHETMFTFEAFEMKFAHTEITHTLLTYLARYKEFRSSENMRRVVSLLHRQAVRAKAEGLFFKVSTLALFKSILADQTTLPREQPYKDLVNLINFILRKFFKALTEEPFLAIEAFFPKNRGNWKHFSSWTPEEKIKRNRSTTDDARFLPDVEVKKGYSWSEQLGIVIASLVDSGKREWVDWTQEILMFVVGQRQRIVEDTDSKDDDDELGNDPDMDVAKKLPGPSDEAVAKFTDYLIPYTTDELADAASKNPELKLLFRLANFIILDQDASELEWYVPAALLPSALQSTLTVINQFLESPIELDGKRASELLNKKGRRRRRRRSPSLGSDSDVEVKKKKEKKKKEKEQYKSAELIADSDVEDGDLEAFLEKEKALRDRVARGTTGGGRIGTMKATGTKKRRKKVADKGGKKRKGNDESALRGLEGARESDWSEASDLDLFGSRHSSPTEEGEQPPRPRPRPRPRPKPLTEASAIVLTTGPADPGSDAETTNLGDTVEAVDSLSADPPPKRKGRLVLSDSEE